MRTCFLTVVLASVILSLDMGTVIAQMINMPIDNQEPSSPTKAPGKRIDPPPTMADHTVNTPMADSEAALTVSSSDTSKPMYKKHRSHEEPGSAMLGGTSSMDDISHPDMQAGGSDATTTVGNSYPGSSKQGQQR